ncbi:MAG: hypothetical protein G3I11_02990, partial [Ferrovum sp.]|nr:hypothetical protein [Ferrovum sp.]
MVKPSDKKRVLEILKINTCLWGGKFNPIIPFFRQVPSWWDRHGHRFDTSKQIINGYLDRYEPDFLVEAEKELAVGLGFNSKRVLQLSDLLKRADDRSSKGNGLSTFDLYKELYLKEFQFERRHKHNITSVTAEDPIFESFCACVFGGFPKQKNLNYLGRAFKDAFDPTEVTLNGGTLARLYGTGLTSALDIGQAKIEVDYHDHSDATLFVLNAQEPRDLIDFWNLRTFQREIIAVPIQWIDELSDYCKNAIKKAYRPMPGNPNGVMLNAKVMFSRSIPQADIERLYQKILVVNAPPGTNSRQDWYPAIWRPTPSFHVGSSRPILTAAEKTFDVQYSEDTPVIRFDSLYPEFAEKYGNANRWANIVKLRNWSFENQIATVLPTEYKDPKFSPFRLGSVSVISKYDGVIFKLTDGAQDIVKGGLKPPFTTCLWW